MPESTLWAYVRMIVALAFVGLFIYLTLAGRIELDHRQLLAFIAALLGIDRFVAALSLARNGKRK